MGETFYFFWAMFKQVLNKISFLMRAVHFELNNLFTAVTQNFFDKLRRLFYFCIGTLIFF